MHMHTYSWLWEVIVLSPTALACSIYIIFCMQDIRIINVIVCTCKHKINVVCDLIG